MCCRRHQEVLFYSLILLLSDYFSCVSSTTRQKNENDGQKKIVRDWPKNLTLFLTNRSKKVLSTNMAKLTLEDMCHLHSAFLAQVKSTEKKIQNLGYSCTENGRKIFVNMKN
uniref:Uncharacterized protein n=1 Tax=Romanomermis culicivorax TaxID=13658 RepID=A0A915JIN7_ROMCU